MLAMNWDPVANDPTGWYMSEKLDGVRCFWNGRNMYTRNGNLFYPPQWFKDLLPKDLALDGELWTKRDDFQKAVSIVRRQDQNEEWKDITYMVYDAPNFKGKFSERLAAIEKTLNKNPSKHLVFHKQVVCQNQAHLDEEMKKVIALKGEGLMIKDPNCPYEAKRSKYLLKVKQFEDTEATVIAHLKGTGRCAAMMGAIQVKMDNGITFKIGSGFDDKQRRKPPKIGSRVTFKFQGLSKSGTPRFPIFIREHPGM
jgi:DNA ligase-1